MATTEGEYLTTDEAPNTFILDCIEIDERFKDYGVSTSNKEIWKSIKLFSSSPKERVLSSYEGSYLNLIKYTNEELQSHCKNSTKEWKKWCNDVAIYYTARLLLYQKEIPIVDELTKADDEALIQAFEEQKTKEKKPIIQDLTRQANKKKAKEQELRKKFEESAAEKELEKLKDKKKKKQQKKQQKKSSKA